jgi:hypothetical protein
MDGAPAPMGSDREEATATTKGNRRSLRDDNKKNKRDCQGNCNSEATAATKGNRRSLRDDNKKTNATAKATAAAKRLQQQKETVLRRGVSPA